jgi:hypothetical protein
VVASATSHSSLRLHTLAKVLHFTVLTRVYICYTPLFDGPATAVCSTSWCLQELTFCYIPLFDGPATAVCSASISAAMPTVSKRPDTIHSGRPDLPYAAPSTVPSTDPLCACGGDVAMSEFVRVCVCVCVGGGGVSQRVCACVM